MLIVSNMKGWLTLCLSFVLIGGVLSLTSCSENSGWNAGMMGVPVNPEANPAGPTGNQEPPQSPPGSGAVDYIPPGSQ
jgi:hypothetical protein